MKYDASYYPEMCGRLSVQVKFLALASEQYIESIDDLEKSGSRQLTQIREQTVERRRAELERLIKSSNEILVEMERRRKASDDANP